MSRRWAIVKALAGAWLAAVAGAGAGTAGAQSPVSLSGERLQRMSPAELDALYRSATPGPQPRGRVRGVAIVAPGTAIGPAASKAARIAWQGKVFRDDGRTAINRFFGVRVIQGNLYYGPSWVDGQPALILDYQGTSRVYGRYRDEIRQVAPGLYLGAMYARTSATPEFTRYFALEARP